MQAFRKSLGLRDEWALAVGVDRMDYTKGIPERLRAVDRFLERYPVWRKRFVFLQMGAPSRTEITEYQRSQRRSRRAGGARSTRSTASTTGSRSCLSRAHHGVEDIFAGYRAANVCVVSSLHDGMNLVAKEFVAARDDRQGVLILSPFTGAAREMPEALLVNPYATDAFADALQHGADDARRGAAAADAAPARAGRRAQHLSMGRPAPHRDVPPGGVDEVTDSCPITLNHGVIGNGRVLALVSPSTHIDWLCMPRFDSASVFGRILDVEKGGTFAFHARLHRRSTRTWNTSSTRTCCARP